MYIMYAQYLDSFKLEACYLVLTLSSGKDIYKLYKVSGRSNKLIQDIINYSYRNPSKVFGSNRTSNLENTWSAQ